MGLYRGSGHKRLKRGQKSEDCPNSVKEGSPRRNRLSYEIQQELSQILRGTWMK